jgi:hypothetical protein
MKVKKIPTIIAILVLVVSVAVGVLLVQNKQIFKIGAAADAAPQDVRITNIEDTNFTISWITDKAVVGAIDWGTQSNNQTNKLPSTDTTPQNVHFMVLSGLTSGTTYYFKIESDGVIYDNSGIPWSIAASSTSSNTNPSSLIASGKVITATGDPAPSAIVYLTGSGLSPLSGKVSSTGTWVIPVKTTLDPQAVLDIFVTLRPSIRHQP